MFETYRQGFGRVDRDTEQSAGEKEFGVTSVV
jgi:hypothetical protein